MLNARGLPDNRKGLAEVVIELVYREILDTSRCKRIKGEWRNEL